MKYVGETRRSAYERGKEHVADFRNLNETSHLLKLVILEHQQEKKLEDMEFGMRVSNSHRTVSERQIRKAVAIAFEKKKGRKLLNF